MAKTVGPNFESTCVNEVKAEFSLVAEEGFKPQTFELRVIVVYLVSS